MKSKFYSAVCIALAFFSVISFSALAQHKLSPHETVSSKIGSANVKITFGSPGVKGRAIWGGLVPYDKPWRAGADEATIFETDKDLKIEGKTLKAGKYSLFAVPGKTEWSFIFNSETGQWGVNNDEAANFQPAKNVLTVKAMPKTVPMRERMAFLIKSGGFSLNWEKLEVFVKAM